MEFKDTLRHLMDEQGVSNYALGMWLKENTGKYGEASVRGWLKGGGIREDALEALSEYFNRSKPFLLFGITESENDLLPEEHGLLQKLRSIPYKDRKTILKMVSEMINILSEPRKKLKR